MDEFIIRALLAGVGVGLVAGPLGVFVVWRRMAYFGDTLAHSALLGVALGFLFNFDLRLSVIFTAIAVSVLLMYLMRGRTLAVDSLLGILAHAALSLGLVAIAFIDNIRIDLMGYLFGDILAVDWQQIIWIWLGAAMIALVITFIWRPLLTITVHEDIARVEGIPVERIQLIFMLLIAVVIALSMNVIGVLLVTALMIIPAASARRVSRTPEQMAIMASLLAITSVLLGLAGSLQWDTPAGPSVVVAATMLFTLSRLIPARR